MSRKIYPQLKKPSGTFLISEVEPPIRNLFAMGIDYRRKKPSFSGRNSVSNFAEVEPPIEKRKNNPEVDISSKKGSGAFLENK